MNSARALLYSQILQVIVVLQAFLKRPIPYESCGIFSARLKNKIKKSRPERKSFRMKIEQIRLKYEKIKNRIL